MKLKCRPADDSYHDDDCYTREIEVGVHGIYKPEVEAARLFAEEECSRRCEYDEWDVQVLMPEGWVTFEINIASVPEFSASRKKGVQPVPDTFVCNECEKKQVVSERREGRMNICLTCFAEWETDARLHGEQPREGGEG